MKGATRHWPPREIDLLLQALHLPAERARRAWKEWSETRPFDAVRPGEARLLAALGRRLSELAPDSPHLGRVRGLARADWARTQATLEASLPAIDLLQRREIPFLLYRSAAEHAEGRGRDRLLTQLDILVPYALRPAAVAALIEGPWRPESRSPASRSSLHATVALRNGPQGRVALRASALPPFYGTSAQDEQVWEGALEAKLGGRRVSVPNAESATLLTLAWGAREDGGTWAVELARRLADTPPDWATVAETAPRWHLVAAALGGLRYLQRTLELPVPERSLRSLEEHAPRWAERASYRAHLGGSDPAPASRRMVAALADRLHWCRTRG